MARAQAAADYVEDFVDNGIAEFSNFVDDEIDNARQKISTSINTFEIGTDNQTKPSDKLIIGGIFYKKNNNI